VPSEDRYARLFHRVWHNQRFRALSHAAKVLFFHSWSNDACGLTGVYRIEPEVLFRGACLSDEEAPAAWKELIPRFIRYDRVKGLIWVCGKFQKENNPSPMFAKGVRNEVAKLPKSRLVLAFCKRYGFETPSRQSRGTQESSNSNSSSNSSTAPVVPTSGDEKSTPREAGTNPRSKATNPRARRASPRAKGTSPRATGDNPRAQRKRTHDEFGHVRWCKHRNEGADPDCELCWAFLEEKSQAGDCRGT